MQNFTDEQLLLLLHDEEPTALDPVVYQSPLTFLRNEIGEDLSVVVQYLTSGSKSAITEARAALRPYVNLAIYNAQCKLMNPTWDEALSAKDADDIYSIPVVLKQAWNFGSVLDEIGSVPHSRKKLRHCLERMLKKELEEFDKRLAPDEASDDYWRGVVLFTVIKQDINITPYSVSAGRIAKHFIKWSGQQEDLGRIYSMVLERKTLEVDTLQDFLDRSEYSRALGRGVL